MNNKYIKIRIFTVLIASSICSKAATPVTHYTIQPNSPEQHIQHFGASDAWSMQFLCLWPQKQQEQIADWLFSLDTDAQGKAVSQLMVAAGHSVQMEYGTEASGTQGSLIAEALINYFDYDKGCHPDWRAVYSYSEWENMVYDNLKNVGPLVFNGHPYNDGGHSFVCDGYDGDGYYHFNWGWGGGGASAGAGFVYNLNGIFGIQKPNDDPKPEIKDNILMYGGCTATVSNGNINFKRNTWYPDGWYC